MMNSSSWLKTPSTAHNISYLLLAGFAAAAVAGFGDATYLSVKHFSGEAPACSLVHGCDTVLTSSYATIGPVPIALIGALYYLAVLALIVVYLDVRSWRALRLAIGLSGMGFAVSIGLVWLQVFSIRALCLYCLGSALSSTILFGFGLAMRRQHARE